MGDDGRRVDLAGKGGRGVSARRLKDGKLIILVKRIAETLAGAVEQQAIGVLIAVDDDQISADRAQQRRVERALQQGQFGRIDRGAAGVLPGDQREVMGGLQIEAAFGGDQVVPGNIKDGAQIGAGGQIGYRRRNGRRESRQREEV